MDTRIIKSSINRIESFSILTGQCEFKNPGSENASFYLTSQVFRDNFAGM